MDILLFFVSIYGSLRYLLKSKFSCGSSTTRFFSPKIIWLNVIGMGVKSVVFVIL
jgi:hypothetical protein